MDEELHLTIQHAKLGDKEAYEQLVTQFKAPVYRFALGMLNDRMDAEDVAQEAFVKAYFALSNLESEYAFSSWLFRIVSNLCKNRLSKRAREREFQEEADETIIDRDTPDPFVKVSMEQSLARLSVDHREVILLHDVQGYRYEEIASMLHIPMGTVKSRLFAARMALRDELRKGDHG
ncbi:RNA polymerase sigma-70 factor (ECF subfamily) [Paenibacillus cellulosilyticus]|uniref:RNA polymerase sigma factor n=1 Tax=Paenibacillus cellulosilyticus TaxID=375489 RepID=A0A2V2YUT5_9BACL|nr:RNA polymerase sigma factor [Paenibacillus cellulosilyticus]PWW04737.1 RNA polymerase sigma-70 factor (ECF subfamily) [Paenibacillus cellulosilyticus]QKS45862.1 RNA polymerase sigma factor [Paenibacillus cellulosilyticus]